jgi:hypothetical protein
MLCQFEMSATQQIALPPLWTIGTMEPESAPRILCVDTLPNAVFVMFKDRKCAIFPAALLYATLSQAQEVIPDEELESYE